MTRWFKRRPLTTILLVAVVAMLQGCACGPGGQYGACGGHSTVPPVNDRGGAEGGGGMM